MNYCVQIVFPLLYDKILALRKAFSDKKVDVYDTARSFLKNDRKHCWKKREMLLSGSIKRGLVGVPNLLSAEYLRSWVLSFIFQLRESPCNITHDISFLIYNGYF